MIYTFRKRRIGMEVWHSANYPLCTPFGKRKNAVMGAELLVANCLRQSLWVHNSVVVVSENLKGSEAVIRQKH